MRVKYLKQTSRMCPSQWEGHLDNGKMLYARYRWGHLTVEVSKNPTNDVQMAIGDDADLIVDDVLSDPLDGYLEESQLRKIMEEKGFIFPTQTPSP